MTFTQFARFLEQRADALRHKANIMPEALPSQQTWMINCITDDFRCIFDNLAALERDTIRTIAGKDK